MESELSERVVPGADGGDTTQTAPAERTNGETTVTAVAPEPQVQVRRVRRMLRRVDPWSVFKLSIIFFACMYGVILVSSLIVWRAAVSSGIIDDVESFIVELGFSDFTFAPDQMFRALLFGGAGMIFVATFLSVLATVLFNLISDLVGGIRLSMIEQTVLEHEDA